MGRAEPIGRTSADINHRNLVIKRERGATRGHPKRWPILVLLSLNHAELWSSDGIRCISAGMIAPIVSLRPSSLIWCDWGATSGVLDRRKSREKFVLTDVLLCEYLGMFVQIGRCAPLEIDAFFRSVRLDSRFGAWIGVWSWLLRVDGGSESLPDGF